MAHAKRCPWVLQHSTTYNTLQHFTTSHKHLFSFQMQIKLSVSSCFLFMVTMSPFLYQLYFYLVKQKFLKNEYFLFWTRSYYGDLHDHTENIWLTNSTPMHFNRVSLNLKEKIFIKKWKVWTYSNFNFQWSLKNNH